MGFAGRMNRGGGRRGATCERSQYQEAALTRTIASIVQSSFLHGDTRRRACVVVCAPAFGRRGDALPFRISVGLRFRTTGALDHGGIDQVQTAVYE